MGASLLALAKSIYYLEVMKQVCEIPPFFQTLPGDLGKKVHACSLRFSALKGGGGRGGLASPYLFNIFPHFFNYTFKHVTFVLYFVNLNRIY